MRIFTTLAALAFTAVLSAPSASAMEPQKGVSAGDDQPSISQKWIESLRSGHGRD